MKISISIYVNANALSYICSISYLWSKADSGFCSLSLVTNSFSELQMQICDRYIMLLNIIHTYEYQYLLISII